MKSIGLIVLIVLLLAQAASAVRWVYSWCDGGTVLGMNGSGTPPVIATNVAYPDPVCSAPRSLRLEHNSPGDTPVVHVAYVYPLTDGDLVKGRVRIYDMPHDTTPAGHLWAHYVDGGLWNPAGDAGGNPMTNPPNSVYWRWVEWTWTFDSAGGSRDGLVIEVRVYGDPGDTIWVDGLRVTTQAMCEFPGNPSPVEATSWTRIKGFYR